MCVFCFVFKNPEQMTGREKNEAKCRLINKKNTAVAYKYTSESSITNKFLQFKWPYKMELASQ